MKLFKSKSPLKKQLDEALSKESWGCANSILQEIALASETDQERKDILDQVWRALEDKNWRRVFKALTLVEVLFKRGSTTIIADIKRDIWRIQKFKEHRVMEQGKDVGGGIREKATIIVELSEDTDRLNKERDKNYEMYEKMRGIGTRTKGGDTPSSHGGSPTTRADAAVDDFVAATGATRQVAQEWINKSSGNTAVAISDYRKEKDKKPGWLEQRRRAEQVQSILEVDEKRATDLLKECDWDVDAAISKGEKSKGSSRTQKSHKTQKSQRSPPSESSSSSSSEDEPRQAKGGGWPGAQQTGWSSQGGFSGGGNAWPSAPGSAPNGGSFSNNGFNQGGFGAGQMQPNGCGGPFGANSGNSGFGAQANNPFGGGCGGGFGGKGGPQNSFGGGGFGGQGGFGSQQGKGGFGNQGSPFGGCGSAGGSFGGKGMQQQGSFSGPSGSFGGQGGGFGGQGFSNGGFGQGSMGDQGRPRAGSFSGPVGGGSMGGNMGGMPGKGGFGGGGGGGFGNQGSAFGQGPPQSGFGGQGGGNMGMPGKGGFSGPSGFGNQGNSFGGQGPPQSGFGGQGGHGGQGNFGGQGGYGGGFGGQCGKGGSFGCQGSFGKGGW